MTYYKAFLSNSFVKVLFIFKILDINSFKSSGITYYKAFLSNKNWSKLFNTFLKAN